MLSPAHLNGLNSVPPVEAQRPRSAASFSGVIVCSWGRFIFPLLYPQDCFCLKVTTSDSFIKIKTSRVPWRLPAFLTSWFLGDLSAGKHTLYTHMYTPHWTTVFLWWNLETAAQATRGHERDPRSACFPVPDPEGGLIEAAPKPGGMGSSSSGPWLPFQTTLKPETWMWIL